ncbi:CobW family GTP-binding protein [Acrocarpospora catenulata]|uniref:CobW family GTP-binding protein n=1 Tax=Acrocarpospora catenulata TaxID=2836182 RepID=UPI001BD9210D|nr:GTP-binding protein [Acrocarpospora catenulata]
MSTPVVLIAGLYASARTATVDRLLQDHPGSIAVHHDLSTISEDRVSRIVRDRTGLIDLAEVSLAHGCVTCTIREDLLPQLLQLASGASLLIVDLWDSVEPRAVAEAIGCAETRDILRLTCVLTALDAERMPIDITRGDRLAGVGKQAAGGDPRYLAGVLATQLEYATGLVLHGGDEEDTGLARAVVAHLAPLTPIHEIGTLPHVTGAALCTAELAERVDPATAQLPCDAEDEEITTVVWRRVHPLHPTRLFEAMDELVTSSVRSRGRFWLPTAPDRLLAWDAVAGVVWLEDTGPWLAALPETAWDTISPARRMAATLDWHPISGDRVQHLVFTGPGLDHGRIHQLLDSCLLTKKEEGAGPGTWVGYDNPFALILDLKEIA